jgi:predicted ATPase
LGIVLFCLGFPDQALAQSNAAFSLAGRLAHSATFAGTLAMVARLLSLVGDHAALDERANQLAAVATEQGFPVWEAQGTIYRGWVKVKHGHVAKGISLLRSGASAYRSTEAETIVPYFLSLLARACETAGQIDEAMNQLNDALQIAERTGERWLEAELYRQKGELVLQQGNSERAEAFYCKALCIARKQGAKMWELRTAASLARLRRDQGRRAEASDLLAQVYGWFTEGFNTPDLKEARALFDELST